MTGMSKKSAPAGGQSSVEYVLALALTSAAAALLGWLLRGAVLVARSRFLSGVASLP